MSKNLQLIESSQSPIMVRWSSLLQSFHFFVVRFIPGRENKVTDWMSRMFIPPTKLPTRFRPIQPSLTTNQ